MRAVDTNVLVRVFVHDDSRQVAAVVQALSVEPIFIPKSVLVEFEWVLRGVYGQSRIAIAAAIDGLLAKADVEVEDSIAIAQALQWFESGMDFADAVHLASSHHVTSFLTFDVSMRRRASMLNTQPKAIAP